jgi:hypothetical protein
VPTLLLTHRHPAIDRAAMFAAWRGSATPLWRRGALSRCPQGGGHRLWWLVEALHESAALERVPERTGRQTEVNRVSLLPIP